MISFTVLDINLSKKFELDMVGGFFGFRVTGEGKAGWFKVDVNLWYIGSRDGKIDVILRSVRGR